MYGELYDSNSIEVSGLTPERTIDLFRVTYTDEFVEYMRTSTENKHFAKLGGLVESPRNLSQTGNCWLDWSSVLCDDTLVLGDSAIMCSSKVFGLSLIVDTFICDSAIKVRRGDFVRSAVRNSRISGVDVECVNVLIASSTFYGDALRFSTNNGNTLSLLSLNEPELNCTTIETDVDLTISDSLLLRLYAK